MKALLRTRADYADTAMPVPRSLGNLNPGANKNSRPPRVEAAMKSWTKTATDASHSPKKSIEFSQEENHHEPRINFKECYNSLLKSKITRTSISYATIVKKNFGIALASILPVFIVAPALAQTIDGGAVETVPGTHASPWNIGVLSVGNTSTGTLNINAGGIVSSSSSFIGRQTTGIGTVTVNGIGAQWSADLGLSVGNFGRGTLSITNGGHVTSITNSYIGVALNSTGTATVSGTGSQWNTNGFLRVGQTGNGTLTISNGGIVSNVLGYVGYDSAGVGSVVVNGATSRWNNTGALAVGQAGKGTLSIINGGVVSSTAGTVGTVATATGAVTVDGSGSRWVNSGLLTVGNLGTGALTISNNGEVTAVSASVAVGGGASAHGVINIGAAATDPAAAPGTLTLTGASPNLTLGANGALVFNHTDTSGGYQFALGVTGAGKVDAYGGVTTLIGTNTYSGGTTIHPTATLQLGNGGTTGSIVGNVANNGVLTFNRADTMTFAGAISGTGIVNQNGSGTTILTSAANSYSGATNINSGVLQAGIANTLSPNSAVFVAAAGTLDLNGFSQSVAGVANAGLINMGTGTPPSTTLTTPSYFGLGGTLAINTYLASDGSASDRLIVNGGTAGGASLLRVSNAGGPGALTIGNGILVVDAISGATTAAGAFALAGPVVAGPYEYTLFRGGSGAAGAQNWYLRSDLINPPTPDPGPSPNPTPTPSPTGIPHYRQETSLYAALPAMGLIYGRTLIDSLHERVGELRPLAAPEVTDERFVWCNDPAKGYRCTVTTQPSAATPASNRSYASAGWARLIGQHGNRDGGSWGIYRNGPNYSYDLYALQAGLDLYRGYNADGSRDHAGVYAAIGRIEGDVTHFNGIRAGTNTIDGYSLGAYWTHFGPSGWYLDGVLQGTWFDAVADSRRLIKLKREGFGFAASLEGGYPIALGNGWIIEPQAQLVYQTLVNGSGSDGAALVRFSDVDSLAGRLGARLARSWTLEEGTAQNRARFMTAWLKASLWNEFRGDPRTSFSSETGPISFRSDLGGAWAEIKAGLDTQITKNTALYASAGYSVGLNGRSHAYDGRLGLKTSW